MTPSLHHPTVSQVVRVALRPAGVGLDFAAWCLTRPDPAGAGAGTEPGWAVVTPAGVLRCDGPISRTAPLPRGYLPHRTADGLLRPAGRGRRPVPVTVELLPWSSRWSELMLTTGPLRRIDVRSGAERAYLRAAHATLNRLATAIEAPPPEWLGRLVTGHAVPHSMPVRKRG